MLSSDKIRHSDPVEKLDAPHPRSFRVEKSETSLNRSPSDYAKRIGKPCTGLITDAASTDKGPASTMKMESSALSPFPSYRWFGSPTRMVPAVPRERYAGDSKPSQANNDILSKIETELLNTSEEEVTSNLTRVSYSDTEEQEESVSESGCSDPTEKIAKAANFSGSAAGAALGFGVGLSIALPVFYVLAGMDSLCTYSWTSKF